MATLLQSYAAKNLKSGKVCVFVIWESSNLDHPTNASVGRVWKSQTRWTTENAIVLGMSVFVHRHWKAQNHIYIYFFRPREKQLAVKPVEGYFRLRPRPSMKTTKPRSPGNVVTKSYLLSLQDVTSIHQHVVSGLSRSSPEIDGQFRFKPLTGYIEMNSICHPIRNGYIGYKQT